MSDKRIGIYLVEELIKSSIENVGIPTGKNEQIGEQIRELISSVDKRVQSLTLKELRAIFPLSMYLLGFEDIHHLIINNVQCWHIEFSDPYGTKYSLLATFLNEPKNIYPLFGAVNEKGYVGLFLFDLEESTWPINQLHKVTFFNRKNLVNLLSLLAIQFYIISFSYSLFSTKWRQVFQNIIADEIKQELPDGNTLVQRWEDLYKTSDI